MARSFERRLKDAVAEVERADTSLADELRDVRASRAREAAEVVAPAAVLGRRGALDLVGLEPETIVLRTGRPVLAVVDDAARLDFQDAESEVWRARLLAAREPLGRAIRAAGRIEVENHDLDWLGTGWLVAEDVVVTNRHVAAEFGRRHGQGFVFRQGFGGRMAARVDFREEFGGTVAREFALTEILHIADEAGPDVAFLRVQPLDGEALAGPIKLAARAAREGQQVAVIGYPARDSRVPDQDLMLRIFGDVFDKKRLAPGQVKRVQDGLVLHDCSTLGGNSGSVVLDLESGEALALHFSGRFLVANFAVAASTVGRMLEEKVATGGPAVVVRPAPEPPAHEDGGDEAIEEARAQDYADREGYASGFIGTEVPLPEVHDGGDVLSFELGGATQRELKYQHFSVLMSRARRLCLFSAVNIDGGRSRKARRPRWRRDPRIPLEAQIEKECYGNEPRFARGHMTRREDPIWGSADTAARGNSDSMHVTNAVPQMQPFNAGIWLGLEDYALENARQDDMKITVITGPVLTAEDPVRFGVRIPTTFWKVIAFVHDETGEPCATAYTLGQDDFLSEEEFVFGRHQTAQVPLSVVEALAGLTFTDELRRLDPLERVQEARPRPLRDFRQIQFR